jgi:hypothetical protein
MSSLSQRWQPIEALTEKMMALAREGEWEEIPPTELERRALLEEFFKIPVSSDEAPDVRDRIQALLAVDKQILDMGSDASKELLGKLNTFATGRKAKQAYSEHA